MPTPRLPCPLAVGLLLSGANAQIPTFRELPQLVGASAAVRDPLRDRTWLAMDGAPARLFEWDGTMVRQRRGELDNLAKVSGFGFDVTTGRVLALGFDLQSRLVYGVHDGCRWNWQAVPQYLSPNTNDPIAFDQARGRFVIYQFHTNSTSRVVEFDGSTWVTTLQPQVTYRYSPAFAYDPLQNRCVLFGGIDSQGPSAEVYQWDGTTFTLLSTNQGPGPRHGATLAFSPPHSGLVLYGDGLLTQLDTWLLSGNTWTRLPTTNDAGPRSQPVLVDDGMGLCAIGKPYTFEASGSRLVGSQWTQLDALVAAAYRVRAAVGFDRNRGELVAFGGTTNGNEPLQVFDGHWHNRQPSPAPAAHSGASFAWSAVDHALLLHGGTDQNGASLTDTWTWDGAVWQRQLPPTTPPPRLYGAFASDPGGGVLLYGGFDGTVRSDHWRWNGSTWQLLAANALPGPVYAALAALDEARQRTVLLGAFPSSGTQTWEWDGASWALRDAGSHPVLSTSCRMAFDPTSGRVVTLFPAVQVWNGSIWQSMPTAGPQPTAQALVTETRRGGLLVLGTGAPPAVTTLTMQPATGNVVGSPCALVTPPSLSTLELPVLGRSDFLLDLGSPAPGAPCVVWFGVGGSGSIGPCAIVTGPTLGIVFGTTDAGGNAQLPLPIPDDRALLGFALLTQGAVYDSARSRIGSITVSAGLALTIGW